MGQKKVNELKVGSIITYINLIISTIIPLLYTPIMLRILGQEEYGLYSLSNSVISYLTLLNLGFGTAIIRFISKFRIEGDHDKIAVSYTHLDVYKRQAGRKISDCQWRSNQCYKDRIIQSSSTNEILRRREEFQPSLYAFRNQQKI